MNVKLSLITDKQVKEFLPLAETLQQEGKSLAEIENAFKNYCGLMSRNAAKGSRVKPLEETIHEIMNQVEQKSSKISPERILYDALEEAKISFVFQKQIGPYTVTFVIDSLIVEIEINNSPDKTCQDSRRDGYLKNRGYYIKRIPANVLFTTPRAAVESIEEDLFDLQQQHI